MYILCSTKLYDRTLKINKKAYKTFDFYEKYLYF